MARVSEVIVSENDIATWKCSSMVTDKDINKPVKISAADTVALCADGDEIYGFIDSIDPTNEDGVRVVGVQKAGRKWVTMSGGYAIGDVVEAAANTAVDTALAIKWGEVSSKSALIGDIANDASGTVIATAVNALIAAAAVGTKKWVVIYGAGTDESEALIELV